MQALPLLGLCPWNDRFSWRPQRRLRQWCNRQWLLQLLLLLLLLL
jgi:hypothetical protein